VFFKRFHRGERGRFLLLLILIGGCLEPSTKRTLELTVLGPVYPRPRCTKGSTALGMLYPLGEPVAKAQIVLMPGEITATTDESGKAILKDLSEGEYTLSVTAPGFVAKQTPITSLSGQPMTLRLDPCIIGGGDRYRVGFNSLVSLVAGNSCGSEWDEANTTWTQLEGPDIRSTVAAWDGPLLTFTTRKLEEVRKLPDEPQLLSFSHDEAGEYVFQVTGRNKQGQTSKDYVLVTSTNATGALTSVETYDIYYVVGNKKGPWKWVIDSDPKTKKEIWPEGWPKTLEGADTRTPSVRPLPAGPLAVQQTLAIKNELRDVERFSLVVGHWDMVNRDCGRTGCHPTLQASWEKTRHATTWQRLLDGTLASARGPAAESCATCHSLGYDRTVPSRGYDDIADIYRISFPEELKPGNYDALPDGVKAVSNVYCLACHGASRVDPPVAEQPGRFSAGVCARCHDRLPEQDLVAQWKISRMAQTIKGEGNGPEFRDDCKQCHTGQGFYYENFALGRPPALNTLVMNCCDNLMPITCQTCHSPMYATNKAQVFRSGSVTTRSGLALRDIGTGALCTTCHNTDHDVADPSTLRERLAPHSPQADLSYGRAGFALPVEESFGLPALEGVACIKDAGEGCVTCHMDKGPSAGEKGYRTVGDHTFRMISTEGVQNARPCQACHGERQSFDPLAKADYDGDAKVETVRAEVDGLMARLKTLLEAALEGRRYRGCDKQKSAGVWFKKGYRNKLVVVDKLDFDLGDCDRNGFVERKETPFLFPDPDLFLYRTAYNYLLVEADKSRGLHNYPYTVKLLQRTLVALTEGKNLPNWNLYR
jgi:hypothetical protein